MGALTWNPVKFMQARFRQWWQARLPLQDSTTLTQRNVYILPTGPGFMLAATLLVLLVASINYQLNLGYILTFLLAGCAVVGMHVCHSTLRGLTLHVSAPEPQFLGTSISHRHYPDQHAFARAPWDWPGGAGHRSLELVRRARPG